ncbi:MAG: hypothetical protein GXO33_03480 [Epsilonproteobacteria bacterium]|nr:hypothetical protein [Campylobacterota bacterium]
MSLLAVSGNGRLLLGLYEKGRLIKRYEHEGKTSEILPGLLEEILALYHIDTLYYAKGPGSFMALKILYVTFKTLSVALNIPLFAADAFAFNNGAPIRAVGRSCFVKKEGKIEIAKGEACAGEGRFALPERLNEVVFDTETEPMYVLPAV